MIDLDKISNPFEFTALIGETRISFDLKVVGCDVALSTAKGQEPDAQTVVAAMRRNIVTEGDRETLDGARLFLAFMRASEAANSAGKNAGSTHGSPLASGGLPMSSTRR